MKVRAMPVGGKGDKYKGTQGYAVRRGQSFRETADRWTLHRYISEGTYGYERMKCKKNYYDSRLSGDVVYSRAGEWDPWGPSDMVSDTLLILAGQKPMPQEIRESRPCSRCFPSEYRKHLKTKQHCASCTCHKEAA